MNTKKKTTCFCKKISVTYRTIWVSFLFLCFGLLSCNATTRTLHRNQDGKIRSSLAALFRNAMSQFDMSELPKEKNPPIRSAGKSPLTSLPSNLQMWNLDTLHNGQSKHNEVEGKPFQNLNNRRQTNQRPLVTVHHDDHFNEDLDEVNDSLNRIRNKNADNNFHMNNKDFLNFNPNSHIQGTFSTIPQDRHPFNNGLPLSFHHDQDGPLPADLQQMHLNNNNQQRFNGQILRPHSIANDMSAARNQQRFPNDALPLAVAQRFPNAPPQNQPRFPNAPPQNQPRFPNASPQNHPRFPTAPPHNQPVFPNGLPQNELIFPNSPSQPQFQNGPPQNQPQFQNGPHQSQPQFQNGPPQSQQRFPDAPPQNQQRFPNGPPQNQPKFPNGPPQNQQEFPNGSSQDQQRFQNSLVQDQQRFQPSPQHIQERFPNVPLQNQQRVPSETAQPPREIPVILLNSVEDGINPASQNVAQQLLIPNIPFGMPLKHIMDPNRPSPPQHHEPSAVGIRNHGSAPNQHQISLVPNIQLQPNFPPSASNQPPDALPHHIVENQLLSRPESLARPPQFIENHHSMDAPTDVNKEMHGQPFPGPPDLVPPTSTPNEMPPTFPRQHFDIPVFKSLPSTPVLDRGPWIPLLRRSHFDWKPSDGISFSAHSIENVIRTSDVPLSGNKTETSISPLTTSNETPEEELDEQLDLSMESLNSLLDSFRSNDKPRTREDNLADQVLSSLASTTTGTPQQLPVTESKLETNALETIQFPESNEFFSSPTPVITSNKPTIFSNENLARDLTSVDSDHPVDELHDATSVLDAKIPIGSQHFQSDQTNLSINDQFGNYPQMTPTDLYPEGSVRGQPDPYSPLSLYSLHFNETENPPSLISQASQPSSSVPLLSFDQHFRHSLTSEVPDLDVTQLLSHFQTEFKTDFPGDSDSLTEMKPENQTDVSTADSANTDSLPEGTVQSFVLQVPPNNQSDRADFFPTPHSSIKNSFAAPGKQPSDWSQRTSMTDRRRALRSDEPLPTFEELGEPSSYQQQANYQSADSEKPALGNLPLLIKALQEAESQVSSAHEQEVILPSTSRPDVIVEQLYSPPLIISASTCADPLCNSTKIETHPEHSQSFSNTHFVKKHVQRSRKLAIVKRRKVFKQMSTPSHLGKTNA